MDDSYFCPIIEPVADDLYLHRSTGKGIGEPGSEFGFEVEGRELSFRTEDGLHVVAWPEY